MRATQLGDYLLAMMRKKRPVLIVSSPGCGKTDIVIQSVARLKWQLRIWHPVVMEPVDVKGYPDKSLDGKSARFLPFAELSELVTTKKPLVVFLDDLGQASTSVQAACMQLLLSRSINGVKISDNVVFVAATNRKGDLAGVGGILEPVKSRFKAIVILEPDANDWITWAINNNIPAELVAFIRFRPDLLLQFTPTRNMTNSPCPRTIVNAGEHLDLGLDDELLLEAIAGAAGSGFASEFMGFLKVWRSIVSPDLILEDPENAPIPDKHEVSALCATVAAVAYRVTKATVAAAFTYAKRLPKEFNVYMMKYTLARDAALLKTTAGVAWECYNSDVTI